MLLAMAACSVGEVPAGGGGAPDAGGGGGNPEATFNANVAPLVTRCRTCHAGLQAPNLTSYTALAAKYKTKPSATNLLVNKGDHQGTLYFAASEKLAVAMWIDSL
jgi:hypothetical protein